MLQLFYVLLSTSKQPIYLLKFTIILLGIVGGEKEIWGLLLYQTNQVNIATIGWRPVMLFSFLNFITFGKFDTWNL